MSINSSTCLIFKVAATVTWLVGNVMLLARSFICSENEGSVVNLDLEESISWLFHFMIHNPDTTVTAFVAALGTFEISETGAQSASSVLNSCEGEWHGFVEHSG